MGWAGGRRTAGASPRLAQVSALRLTVTATVAAAAATAAVTFLPFLHFAYDAPALHAVLETANGVIALLVAFLTYGRFRVTSSLRDALLTAGLGILCFANLVLTAVPLSVTAGQEPSGSSWAAIALRLMGTLLLGAAAAVGPQVRVPHRTGALLGLATGGAGVLLAVLLLAWSDRLPPPVDPGSTPADSTVPVITGHPALLAAQAVGMLVFAYAAVVFTRQAVAGADALTRWLGAACVVAAFGRLNYLLFPSLYSDFVYTGDLLRFGFYALLMVGAVGEIASYWAVRTEAAVLEDRRRLARELHDGLTQELSYIWSQSRLLTGGATDAVVVERLEGASARALDEARRAIAALTLPLDLPFHQVLRQQVEEMARRYDVEAPALLDPEAEVGSHAHEALLRITGEAFRNAVRHGGASRVEVELRAAPLSLVVRDDGRGFDPAAAGSATGFGLVSMRERAEALGARWSITSAPARGTVVRVVWP